jgi:hypothetical protein
MVKILVSLSAVLFFLSVCIDGYAFRCGGGFVNIGDSKAKVLMECGKPTSKEKSGTKKKGRRYKSKEKDENRSGDYVVLKERSKPVEKWYYNCGDNDFIYVLIFEGGILKSENTEGYGKGKSDCKGR